MISSFTKKNKGFSLLEIIIYITFFSILLFSVFYATNILISSYQKIKIIKRIENSAIISMDRMIQDIRNSSSVDIANSVFGSSPGILSLVSDEKTIKFYILNNQIYMEENGDYQGPLSSPKINVSSLIFDYISTSTSVAVKIKMTISDPSSLLPVSKNFYDTAVLRKSY